jgi:hypothetical protein
LRQGLGEFSPMVFILFIPKERLIACGRATSWAGGPFLVLVRGNERGRRMEEDMRGVIRINKWALLFGVDVLTTMSLADKILQRKARDGI